MATGTTKTSTFSSRANNQRSLKAQVEIESTIDKEIYNTPSIGTEVTNAFAYMSSLEGVFEDLVSTLSPILPSNSVEVDDRSGIKEGSDTDELAYLVRNIRMLNKRLYELKYNLQQLTTLVQL